jgi:hypothetical protein
MNPAGNREAGDRNLSTADLAAAARPVDNGPDAPRSAKDTPLSDRTVPDRGREPAGSAAERSSAAMTDATDRKSETLTDAAGRRGASMTDAAAKPATDRGAEQLEPLFSSELAGDYRARWAAVQSSFVDDPKRAVREGDELVAQMIKNLAQSFAAERGRLETQLGQAGDTTTETLRVSLRRYRSFFERLLSL